MQGRKNPFNQRRQTAQDDDLGVPESNNIHQQPTFGPGAGDQVHGGKGVGKSGTTERKNTSGTLNRNESQSQLTTSFEPMDQREVELRAQSGENSQLFMESSQFTTAGGNNGGGQAQMMGRFGMGADFAGQDFDHDGVEAAMGMQGPASHNQ